jgi:hypothetical protein
LGDKVFDKNESEDSLTSKSKKKVAISSPTATGGAGNTFEEAVGAYWLAQLLVGAIPPILIDCSVAEVHFQTEHLGWRTDDLLIVGRKSDATSRKLALQVKRSFAISSSDEDCKNAILDFWTDFNNAAIFSQATDRFGIITQLGTNTLLRHFGSLLECARAAQDAEDFEHRLSTPGFLSSTAIRYCDELIAIISGSEGGELRRREIFRFLRVVYILSLDLSSGTKQAEAAVKSLLSFTAVDENKSDSSGQTWNELLSLVAEAVATARSLRREDLPETLTQRHDTCGLEHPMLVALREHSEIILAGIRSTIGKVFHLRRAGLVQQVLSALEKSRLVLLSAPAGMGKSVVAKEVLRILSRDHFSFSFRAEEFAQPHFDATLTLSHIPGRAAALNSVLAGQERKIVLVESIERLLEKSTRDAFADLLTIASKDHTFRIILTCRDYSSDLVRTAFLRDVGIDHEVVHVPQLNDGELFEVQTANTTLELPLGSPTLRKILRNPYFLDKALLMRWSPDVPLPASEREFRDLFWREIVRADHRSGEGMPSRRGVAFSEVALRRARSLSMYSSSAGLDHEALDKLRADSLLVRSEQSETLIAPAHDVLEDWAILRWIDDRYAEVDSGLKALSEALGVHPALRRAFRKWISELLERDPSAADGFFRKALREVAVPASFRDDILVALLRAESAPRLLEHHRRELVSEDKRLLKRLIHLTRVGCVTAPAWLQGKAALFNVPDGPAWAALLSITEREWAEFEPDDSLLVLGLLEDWAKLVSVQLAYPDGASSAAVIAYRLLEHFDDHSHEAERKRTLQVIAKIPKADREKFHGLLSMSRTRGRERNQIAEELQDIVFAGPLYESFPAARDVPGILTDALRNHLLCTENDLRRQGFQSPLDDIELYFGLRPPLRHGYFPASAYRTPILPLLRRHRRIALDFIVGLFSHVADWYAHPRVRERLEPAFEVELRLPEGTTKKQWCNGRLWNLYRGTSVGPDVLKSYLMALERWLYEVAKQIPDNLDAILLDLLKKSDNGAIAAVVASVATAFPFQSGESLLTLLSARDYIIMDRHRLVAESHTTMDVFGNLIRNRSVENRVYETERKEADKWPHRRQDLESAITNLQLTSFAQRVQTALDAHRRALGEPSTQDEEDRIWRLAIHRMDLRGYQISDDKALPVDQGDKGYVRFELKDPEPDLKEMVERNAPRFERIQHQTGLLMWALRRFKREIQLSNSDEWKEKLKSAMSFERAPETDPMENAASGAPSIVAAVCVRDHWEELSEDAKSWCIERICSSVLMNAHNWNTFESYQRFEMSPDRSCAWAVSTLIAKGIGNQLEDKVKEAFVAALTHPIEEVGSYATWGVAELWQGNRELARRSVYAIAMEAYLIATGVAVEEEKPYAMRRAYEEIAGEAATAVRKRFWQPQAVREDAYDRLSLDDREGLRAHNRILAILGKAPAEPLAAKGFARAARSLVQWWRERENSSGRRERDYEAELNSARLIEEFVMRCPIDVAKTVLEPILRSVPDDLRELHNFIEGLLLAEDREPNTKQFWTLWSWFAEEIKAAPWTSHLDDRYSRGREIINSIFLNTLWKEEVRHWRSLDGYAHYIHSLFEQLPASFIVFEAYVRFLHDIGEQSLPHAFVRIAARLSSGGHRQLLRKANTIFMLESILQRYIYAKPLELKKEQELRDSILVLLDFLVELGSSAAFKMRDDFVTPVSF